MVSAGKWFIPHCALILFCACCTSSSIAVDTLAVVKCVFMQTCNIGLFWYAFFSISALFPSVGSSLPHRRIRKCLQSYLSSPAEVVSAYPFPLYYYFSFVHCSLPIKPSSVTHWFSSWRTLWTVWNTRNGRTRYPSLSQIHGGATTSATCTQSNWCYFSHPGNPSWFIRESGIHI